MARRQIGRLAIVAGGTVAARALTAVAELNRTGDAAPVTTVLMYPDADRRTWYVREADEAVPLPTAPGTAPPAPVLDPEATVEAVRRAGCDAVWFGWPLPGGGAALAERCAGSGILFAGADRDALDLLGDAAGVRELARGLGIPVRDPERAPAATGHDGGRHATATGHHGDRTGGTGGREIEIPVAADRYGVVWSLDPREPTVWHRGRRVVEESGADVLAGDLGRAVADAAVRLVRAAGHHGTASVRFDVEPATGRYRLTGVDTGPQATHPATEETTGLDLVKLQLHLALGGRLPAAAPAPHGHAFQVAPRAGDDAGRLAAFAVPTGAGIRVDTGLRVDDPVAPGAPIATITARGDDRTEALARLRHCLERCTVVVAGGATDVAFLAAVLARDEVRGAVAATGWLDRAVDAGEFLPAPDPVALCAAAVEAYHADHAGQRAAFLASAARGRPDTPAEVGHRCTLRYHGVRYRLRVLRTRPGRYRVESGATSADLDVSRHGSYERVVTAGHRRHRVVISVDGPWMTVEVDGRAHRIRRDEGNTVPAALPALVSSVLVGAGDRVSAGDPLLVTESMKLQTTVTAPWAGEVVQVYATENSQVDSGAPLVRIRADLDADGTGTGTGTGGRDAAPIPPPGWPATGTDDRPPCERVYRPIRGYLLGYDLDPMVFQGMLTEQGHLGGWTPPDDPRLLACEDDLLDLFIDVTALCRPRERGPDALDGGSPQEYLLAYLRFLDADRAGLPAPYRDRLERALARYGVPGLARSPRLEEAVFRMYRSFRRVGDVAPAVTAILHRRLWHRPAMAHLADADMRARLDRLVSAAEGRHPAIADLARDVRFRYLDEPLLATVARREYAAIDAQLDALRTQPEGPDRDQRIDRLVAAPRPLGAVLLGRWLSAGADPDLRRLLLVLYARRFYLTHRLRDLAVTAHDGQMFCSAEFGGDPPNHLVVGFAALGRLGEVSRAVADHLAGLAGGGGDRHTVVDLATWRTGDWPDSDAMATEVRKLLHECDFGRWPDRLNITVTDAAAAGAGESRTRNMTFIRAADGGVTEQPLHRDLHPAVAERLELWRLSSFGLQRLSAPDDIYLFLGTAHDNPDDQRLFALAEVRDLTPAVDAAGTVTYPRLELVIRLALSAMRRALAALAHRPATNRIVLYVRPPWTVPPRAWTALARALAPLAAGTGLEKTVLRVLLPAPDGGTREAVLHVEGFGARGITVREGPVGTRPVRSLTPYRQKVLRAQRFRAPYPYEIVRVLAPPPGAVSRFPTGSFVEYDLDGAQTLVPVDRPYGGNTANIVVGLLTSRTAKVPEGMTRVLLASDPTRGLGNVAEPECRRIVAALDLADRMRVPVEWFALSSGARVAMDSGTENMDWVAAVLRRLVEFTQAGGEVNVVLTGLNVGAQPYWNAEATMLMHTRGILVMIPEAAMVLTGAQALAYSGAVSAEDNFGVGGFDRVMGPNGQAQYWAASWEDACDVLLRHYEHSYVVPGERFPRSRPSGDPVDRDIRSAPHPRLPDGEMSRIGDIFSTGHNPERKRAFDIRALMRAVSDTDARPLERWGHWRDAETVVVWDTHLGGIPVCLLGIQSRIMPRRGFVPADGPPCWASGTLYPQSARKAARAINAASGNRPVVVLANLAGCDGSPESMRRWQLEYGAEIARAVTNFAGPMVLLVVSRFHGGAFVVFAKRLNDRLEIAAVEGSYASVMGGAPAAATVFARQVRARADRDPRVVAAAERWRAASEADLARARAELAEITAAVRAEKLGVVAGEFDAVHTVQRALAVGSIDRIVPAAQVRPYLVEALRRGMAAGSG